MSVPPYQLRQCDRPSCRFRFPVTDNRQSGERCPHCGAPTQVVRLFPRSERPIPAAFPGRPAVEALLDNIRSVYNVGSIFRTADGAGIRHLHLCGITPPPTHPKVIKTALGAETAVSWTQYRNGLEAAAALKARGYQLWAIEECPQAESLFTQSVPTNETPILLLIGNEITGIDPDILAQCDRILHIPMQGIKNSLNVATAFGIAAYFVRQIASSGNLEAS